MLASIKQEAIMQVQEGDIVTWRSQSCRPDFMPLGIANCRVLKIGRTEKGEPAARIMLPAPFNCEAGALLDELTR
jgi:hypothetical protein